MTIKQYSATSLKKWRLLTKINFVCLIVLMLSGLVLAIGADSKNLPPFSLVSEIVFSCIFFFSFFFFLFSMKFEEISSESYERLEKELVYVNNQSLTNQVKEIFKNQGGLLCYFNSYSIYIEIYNLRKSTSLIRDNQGKQFFMN